MLNLILSALKSGNVETIYFDTFKLENIDTYEIISHPEENILEFYSGNELHGGSTNIINLNSCTSVRFERKPDPDSDFYDK